MRLLPESRRTPLQEGGGEERRGVIRGNAMTRKKARARERDQERIAKHYTRVNSGHGRGKRTGVVEQSPRLPEANGVRNGLAKKRGIHTYFQS